MSMDIFEQASRLDLLFESSFGSFYTNDLWKLPLISQNGKVSLDELAKKYHNKIKNAEQPSFVEDTSLADALT